MSADDLRKRLERLNRGPLPGAPLVPADRLAQPPTHRSARRDGRLETILPGRTEHRGRARCYVVERAIGESWPPGRQAFQRFISTLNLEASARRADSLHPDLAAMVRSHARRLLFVDLETCGFAGTPVFLIGALYVGETDFHIVQLLARTYDEEAGIVSRFAEMLSQRPHLVTFNGKSFDWPFLADRAAVVREPLIAPAGHCDLLHVARRRYKSVLPDCRLTTMERFLCGRHRVGDIEGRDIPAAYHDFVRTGDARALGNIVHHNLLDLFTLTEIVTALLSD